jgi:hypothetical protein
MNRSQVPTATVRRRPLSEQERALRSSLVAAQLMGLAFMRVCEHRGPQRYGRRPAQRGYLSAN